MHPHSCCRRPTRPLSAPSSALDGPHVCRALCHTAVWLHLPRIAHRARSAFWSLCLRSGSKNIQFVANGAISVDLGSSAPGTVFWAGWLPGLCPGVSKCQINFHFFIRCSGSAQKKTERARGKWETNGRKGRRKEGGGRKGGGKGRGRGVSRPDCMRVGISHYRLSYPLPWGT